MSGDTRSTQDTIRKLAYAIYIESKETGLENDPLGDWLKAERICSCWMRRWRWNIPWWFKRHPQHLTAVFAFLALVISIITTAWVVQTNKSSADLENRAYVSVNLKDPIRFKAGESIFYGNNILLKNGGKTPAQKVSTSYYITTDMDKYNLSGEKWFDEHLGGRGSVSYIAPGAEEVEPGFRDLSPAADYYYFEALTTYKGLGTGKKYWTHVRKAFFHHKPSGQLYPVFSDGEWDTNVNFVPPPLSTQEQVIALLGSIKVKRTEGK
jgi:hypothetical protein